MLDLSIADGKFSCNHRTIPFQRLCKKQRFSEIHEQKTATVLGLMKPSIFTTQPSLPKPWATKGGAPSSLKTGKFVAFIILLKLRQNRRLFERGRSSRAQMG
jgi:hypothetical protein